MSKILLIDDDPDVRSVLCLMLQRQGYTVETAAQREEAWQKLGESKPSLILLDVLLSGTDGRELCREIKNTPQTKHIPIILFSGHPRAGLQIEAYGADDFIAKPFSSETLLEKLNQQMKVSK